MKHLNTLSISVGIALVVSPSFAGPGEAGDRVTSLLGRMTLEEKVGQLCQRVTQDLSLVNGGDMEGRAFDNAIVDVIRRGEVGTFVGVPGPEAHNLYQKAAVEGSRLGIPLMFGRGYVHGCHVTFPIPLAQSCSWEPELFRRTCEFTAAEARGEGVNWFFAPMLDIARDARWGRIAESLGMDPFLASRIAADVVRGCQGADPSDGRHVAACAKHFVGYGAGEGGRDYNGAEIGDDLLHNVYLPPFKAAIEASVMTVMPAFSTLCGSPCSTDRRLLRDILRDELGFRGFAVSDWDALGECGKDFHGVADGDVALAALAINAGMDVDMLSTAYAKGLAEAVRRGLVKERTLDEAVANVLRVKEKLGLFERPYLDLKAAGFTDRAKGLALAREAGRKSCVLLKNRGGVLPFRRGARLALGGPLADAAIEMYGCWTINLDCNTNQSLRAGLEADGFKVEMWSKGETQADAIVLALGEKGDESGENTSRTDLTLPRGQMELVRAAKATGRPVVVVLFNGRPLAVPELKREADAILEAWQLGSCCGWAVADVLAGVVEPYGRLTVDFPQSSGQCPFYYNRLPTGRPNDDVLVYSEGGRWATRYTDVPLRAVYPFGFGLTYTEFRYSEESAAVVGDEVVLSARIANVGKRRGSEVVQAYVRDRVAEVSRPRRELKGFARVELAPGESRRVEIRVSRAELAYWANGRRTEATGEFLAWIAPDSDSGRRLSFTLPD